MTSDVLAETERLRLRAYGPDDADRVLDIHSRLEVIRWLDDPPHVPMRDRAEALAWVERWASEHEADPRVVGCAVEVKQSGVVAGTALIAQLPNSADDAPGGLYQIGWHLHPDSTGRGYATEAARALLGHGFASGLPEIYAVMYVDNEPSAQVCRRLGMRDLGVVRRWYDGDSQCFRLTSEEWLAMQPQAGPPEPVR